MGYYFATLSVAIFMVRVAKLCLSYHVSKLKVSRNSLVTEFIQVLKIHSIFTIIQAQYRILTLEGKFLPPLWMINDKWFRILKHPNRILFCFIIPFIVLELVVIPGLEYLPAFLLSYFVSNNSLVVSLNETHVTLA